MDLRSLVTAASAVAFSSFVALSPALAANGLGTVDFPTSGSGAAQPHFLRGVAALHSFWYDEALKEFRAATAADPGFAMGYWGEAMTYNHPLWGQAPDVAAARQALAHVKDGARQTPKERAFVEAVRVLYGEGDKPARDQRYAEAMEKVHRAYPEDLEAASFYALALLGTAHAGTPGEVGRRMQAAAIALDIFKDHPTHPGAAHYIIHAFDDPDHAILALPAARQYAAIAPEAFHALHMPSHIFLQLGMWPEVTASNEAAWKASQGHDFHSLQWLQYSYLQQGRSDKARELLALATDPAAHARMAATLIVETEAWGEAAALLPDALKEPIQPTASAHPAACGIPQDMSGTQALFVRGLAAARLKAPDAPKILALLKARQAAFTGPARQQQQLAIQELELVGAAAAAQGRLADARQALGRASELEAQLASPSGPPELIKPASELYGEVLLAAGKRDEAAQQFKMTLARHANRARALQGEARAAEAH